MTMNAISTFGTHARRNPPIRRQHRGTCMCAGWKFKFQKSFGTSTTRSASLRLGALILTALVLATHARAGTITAYTDRNVWETAAAAAGLTVDVETFDGLFTLPNLNVGPANVQIGAVDLYWDPYDRNLRSGRDYTPGADIEVDLVDVAQGSFVFGLGFNYSGPGPYAHIVFTDVDGEMQYADTFFRPPAVFLGIIGTSAIDPENPQWLIPEIAVQSLLSGYSLD